MNVRHLPVDLWKRALRHKIIAGFLALAALWAGYYVVKKIGDTSGEVRYVLAAAEKSTLVISVSGSGQV